MSDYYLAQIWFAPVKSSHQYLPGAEIGQVVRVAEVLVGYFGARNASRIQEDV